MNDPARHLTQRQLELIALFASGYDYRRIASAKFLSYNTVRNTLERARQNVGADSLTHLCVLSLQAGVIVPSGQDFVPVVDPYVVTSE